MASNFYGVLIFVITPRARMRSRGKAIGVSIVCRLSSVDPKIAISQDLGT
jgi:hypothetical protein